MASDPRFTGHDTGPGHPERPARLRAVAEGLEQSGLGSDVQLQNLGPTQNAWVPRAIRPYATLELTGSGLLQSPTDPDRKSVV